MRALILLLASLAGACVGATQKSKSDDACAAQICTGDQGVCDMVVLSGVWIWNGRACVQAYDSGCATVGPDCDKLYASKTDCEAAWSRCLQ